MRNWREDTLAWSRWAEIHLVSWQIETGDQPLVDPGQLHLHSHFLLSTVHCGHIGQMDTLEDSEWTVDRLTYRKCPVVVRRSRMCLIIVWYLLTAPLLRLMCDAILVFSSCKVGPVFVQYYQHCNNWSAVTRSWTCLDSRYNINYIIQGERQRDTDSRYLLLII